MIRIVMLAIAMLAAASLQASSQPSGSRAIVGWGLKSCGTWTQVRQATESADHTVIEAWVVGFMSGMNLDRTHPDALVGTDFDGLMAWIDNYCRSPRGAHRPRPRHSSRLLRLIGPEPTMKS